MMGNKLAILLAAVLMLTGCGRSEGEPDDVPQIPAVDAVETEQIPEEVPAYPENPAVSAVYGNEYTGERESYTADDSEYASEVVFLTDGAVRDFRLLGLTLEEITDDGEVVFSFEELYVYGELTPEKGLAVRMNIPETIPYYGISYMDGTGAVRVFSVNYSGFDGSVQLAEIGG